MAEERVTRKLAAILAADMVGYSRLMEADETGTLARWKVHREELIDPKLAEHRGRVVKIMGDGMLAEFASVVDAVTCAVEFQQAVAEREADVPEDRRIAYRVGINLGDIVVEDDDVYGDGVNVAARLEALAKPGEVLISGTAFDQLKSKLDYGYRSYGERRVKNIAEPVRVYGVLPGATPGSVVGQRHWAAPGWQRAAVAAAVALFVIIAAALWWRPWKPAASQQAKALSIVVLPFANLSGDAKQDYFADAITEDLITDLSRIRGAFVIARGTAFTYKGKAVNAQTIARQLHVHYLLDGSVERSGNEVRVNAQLIAGDTGAEIWSAQFDREFNNLFAVQSAITGRIAAVLRAELLEAESRRPKPADMQAWDYAVKGQVMLHNIRLGPNVLFQAKRLFEQALALDPNQELAWEGLAFIHFAAATREVPGVSVPNSSELALRAARKAVSLDPRSSNAHVVLGLALLWKGQGERALAACDTALNLNRNNDDAYLCAAQAETELGKPAAAIPLLETSRKLNPRFRAWRRHFYMGMARFALGQYGPAVIALSKAKAEFPKHQSVNLYLAAALAMQGHVDQARIVLDEYVKLAHGKRDTIQKLRAERGHIVPNFKRLAEALRRAGMPER